ncbi:deoxyribodipyrimidine photo-lyase [Tautonia sociabilis]|uniref:Deoxyribodipyrimidine photo-lyase n=1 Tax=Tautonia sociabilis TaxID=2080755 RepID=A0A432MDF7_9BACT|nr:deoxyribodipyrimidine photo-lyase [Tautonia sociabilis]RUL82205.1 deoxyribodipyrimidine photolyase [Tautonia sociabilis]
MGIDELMRPDPRVRVLREGGPADGGRCVLYWMQRSQRAEDSPALDLAIALGNALGLPVLAAFGLTASYPAAQRRHYRFLLDAMPEIRDGLAKRGVAFVLRLGEPDEVIAALCREVRPAFLVGDENPLRGPRAWRDSVAGRIEVPFRCVDGDVVVPSSLFPRQEYAARTIRPKIHRVWREFLKPPGPEPRAEVSWRGRTIPRGEAIDPDALLTTLKVGGVSEVPGYRGGPAEAKARLARFVADRLPQYASRRNEPTPYMTSELSAHLHFGHISPVRCALAAMGADAGKEHVDAYLEELVVRRELAVNFVARNPDYDRLEGCPSWALSTLARHAHDPRPHHYSPEQLEAGATHDPLWNAAQKEMVLTGRMHNYLRMYWAKKILEWSPDAASAFAVAVDLNDRYEMDGRDPNGYTGISWAIGGTHDRPWPERPIYGTVRSMSFERTRKKFDATAYIRRIDLLAEGN